MLENFPFYLAIIVAIVMIISIANKIKVAYPVLLVLAGLGISFIPGIPLIKIDPELIFFIFLPPLLYEAAWMISWKELWHWRRIICSFAFVVVFLTALAVAFVANSFIPGFSLALGFLLGGIVSPPDAVSAGAILKFVKVPKRISSILEGESLLNDASSLIIFRFAAIAVTTGQFIWTEALVSFGWMLFGGLAIGVSTGYIFIKLHKYIASNVNADIILTLVAPYIMYLLAEEVHSSGVLAVVSGGLLLAEKRHLFLSSSSRLRGFNVWESLAFALNGIVFILIGLDLPEITSGLGDVRLGEAIGYGVVITLVLVAVRMLSAYGAVFVTLIARNFITVADRRHPGYRGPFLIGWTGMRGVVSLAAALSIPLTLPDGSPFPERNLILFVTFVVILLTLVLQGLSLPWLIKKLELTDPDHDVPEDETDRQIRGHLAKHALSQLHDRYSRQLESEPFLQQMEKRWEKEKLMAENIELANSCRVVYLDLIDEQRQWLYKKNREELALDEDIVRKHLKLLDLEEEKIREL